MNLFRRQLTFGTDFLYYLEFKDNTWYPQFHVEMSWQPGRLRHKNVIVTFWSDPTSPCKSSASIIFRSSSVSKIMLIITLHTCLESREWS